MIGWPRLGSTPASGLGCNDEIGHTISVAETLPDGLLRLRCECGWTSEPLRAIRAARAALSHLEEEDANG